MHKQYVYPQQAKHPPLIHRHTNILVPLPVPFYVSGFFKIISVWIDPVTKQKIKFNEDLRNHVPPGQLQKKFGGDVEFDYDHDKYWPALVTLAKKRRAEMKQRWEKAGKQIGESENYMRGGSEKSVGQKE